MTSDAYCDIWAHILYQDLTCYEYWKIMRNILDKDFSVFI